MEVTIYEFSTGIQVEGTPDNWYSTGFTGEYMDRTIDPIPKAVIKAIDNKLFAIKSVHSLNEPALIAREVIGESGDEWSVVAVLSRREDDCQRPVLLHRYFLCPGLGNIDNILDWFKEYEPNNPQKIPTFDHFYAKRGVYNFQTKSTHIKIRDRRETELQQSCPIIIDYRDSSCTHIIVNAIAKEKNELDNQGNDREILPFSPANDYWGGSSISSRASLPQKLRDSLNNQEYVNNNESRKIIENTRDVKLISWAYNVPELERVMSFMVIKPADQNAKIGMSTIKQAPPPPPPSLVDENELKRTIGQWMGTSEKVSFESLEALEVALLRADPGDINNIKFWNHLLGGLGLNDFKNGNNYPALGKLLVVQAIIFPDEISKTLIWLRDNKNQKNYEQSCLDFQARLANVLKENPKKFETIKGRCTSGVEKLIFKVNDNHARLSLLANGIWADRVEDYLKVNYNYDNHTTTTNIKNLKSQYIDTLELKKIRHS
ncbi:MAG: hypothetical protein N5P05_002675 [Chroococcopsis gigantea SAG 12.99]|nr:hypothetical protein [Chroococcopsis gigantea SAG 12.99]